MVCHEPERIPEERRSCRSLSDYHCSRSPQSSHRRKTLRRMDFRCRSHLQFCSMSRTRTRGQPVPKATVNRQIYPNECALNLKRRCVHCSRKVGPVLLKESSAKPAAPRSPLKPEMNSLACSSLCLDSRPYAHHSTTGSLPGSFWLSTNQ